MQPMTQSPSQSMDSFAQLFDVTPNSIIKEHARTAWADPTAMLERMDATASEVQMAYACQAATELRFKKKHLTDAMSCIANVWVNGYVFTRIVYDTEMTAVHYTATYEEVKANGQRLIDFAESIEIEKIFDGLARAVEGIRDELVGPEDRVLVRRLGHRVAEGVLLAAWAHGVAIGIAERWLFVSETNW